MFGDISRSIIKVKENHKNVKNRNIKTIQFVNKLSPKTCIYLKATSYGYKV